MNPNNYSFIKHVKLISAIPMHWIGKIPTSHELFLVSKKRAMELIIYESWKIQHDSSYALKKQVENVTNETATTVV